MVASASEVNIIQPTSPLPPGDANGSSLPSPQKPTTIEASETVVYQKRAPHPLRHLLFGTPSVSSKLSLATLLINTLLALATWDLTFRTTYFYPSKDVSFGRIGYVGPTSARLLFREPDKRRYPVSVWYSHADPSIIDTHLVDSIPSPTEETDYTKTVTLHHLTPETKYRWFTSSNHSGTFTTAPRKDEAPKEGVFTFLTTSCIKAGFPYRLFAHPLRIQGFRHLADWIERLEARFMLFLGDFIYIDVPRRPGVGIEAYRQ